MNQDYEKILWILQQHPDNESRLAPRAVKGIEYCFSPGVNTVSDFENQLTDRKIGSFLADFSVDAPPILRPEFTFDKKFIGLVNRDPYFTLAT